MVSGVSRVADAYSARQVAYIYIPMLYIQLKIVTFATVSSATWEEPVACKLHSVTEVIISTHHLHNSYIPKQ